MSTKLFQLTKDATIPISLGLLFAMVVGIYGLAVRVHSWETRLDDFEQSLQETWNYQMQKQFSMELRELNPEIKVPNVATIRTENAGIFEDKSVLLGVK
jgi:hypothetical protein